MKRVTSLLMAALLCIAAQAQYTITGKVIDAKDSQPLPGAAVTIAGADGTPMGQISDLDGLFTIKANAGKYTFKVAYTGYKAYEKTIEVKADMKMNNIRLKEDTKDLAEVQVKGTMVRQEQRGDTTVFNADAFKVNPDATTEDLIKKMPGITVEGSTVKSGGEQIKKVLVDGKEFFGSDPMMALKNISADMVSKIEVFDKASDQSAFTGFSDGNEERTINIMTKMGISSGYFGRVYAGYGSDNHYESGGNFNIFNGDHRVSIIGMLNDINQQNFAMDDFTGAMSMGGGMRGMFRQGQGGKNRTGSIGLNYTYEKEDKIKIEASYFYNNMKNNSASSVLQEYTSKDVKLDTADIHTYDSESESESLNQNHRANMRLTWTIDPNNSIIFSPSISWQGTESSNWSDGYDRLGGNWYQSMYSESDNETNGIQGRGWLLWRHKFDADHRTISVNVSGNGNTSNSDGESGTERENLNNKKLDLFTSQKTTNDSKNYSVNGSVMYTEPLGEHMALQANYSPSYTYRDGNKVVMADTVDTRGTAFGSYTFSEELSSKMSSEYVQHRAGVGLNIFNESRNNGSKTSFNATIGLDYQNSTLSADREFPIEVSTSKSFQSILPSANVRWRQGQNFNLNLRYRTSTSAPSISNLQDVLDISNLRSYSIGNSQLNQSYTHSGNLFIMKNNMETSRAIFVMLGFNQTSDYIGNYKLYLKQDTTLNLVVGGEKKEVKLPANVEFTQPINLDGYYSMNLHTTFSTPVNLIRSNVNFSLGANISSTPTMYNNVKGSNDSYMLNGGVSIGSNISENVDFTIGYNGNYTIQENSFSDNRSYYSHTISTDLNCLFANQRLVFTNNLNHQMTDGMGNGFDNSYIMWNAGLGVKFFEDRRGELKFKVNDILDKNTSVSQSVTDNYVQTSSTDVMRRYCMVTFTYKFKPKGTAPTNNNMGPFPGGGRGGMMPPPPGGGGHR